MIYHINVNIGRQLTGIESAAIQRHKLLKQDTNSRLITIRFNHNLKENMLLYGLNTDDYINMYDFFQEATVVEKRPKVSLADLFPETSYTINRVSNINDYRIFQKDQYIAYAHLNEDQMLSYINYFDAEGKKRKRHLYDSRGFLSRESLLDDDQKVLSETYFSPKGKTCLEKVNHYDQNKVETEIRIHHKKQKLCLKNEEDLITLFLDELLTNQDVAISDKNVLVAASLLKATKVGKRIAILHSKHYSGFDPKIGNISGVYKEVFNHLDQFDSIVCSTERQRNDLVTRFGNENKFVCIPVGIRKDIRKKRAILKQDITIRLGVVARYYAEKRLDHVIKAFKKVHSLIPNTELHLFGFGDARERFKTEKELIRLTKQLNLSEAVKFRGYLVELDDEYKKMHAILLTSSYEGFCLALLEGISYGIPAISYDINYGPKEMIDSGTSGYLVTNGCIEELADKVIETVSDPSEYAAFSKRSFDKSKDFSKEIIKNKWNQLII